MARQPGEVSRDDRDCVILLGTAVLPDAREVGVRLTNLSRDGCRIESGESLAIGERVRLHVEALDGVWATVRWSLGGAAGLRFSSGDWT